jgi:hypothetical protein
LGCLSCEKLTLHHFAPLIAKVDRYLSGWCALLLSAGGQIVLLNAVLDTLLTFAMGALELPPALLRAIDALRRAFLWNVVDRASGAKCLVAWDAVCRPKREVGLGIKCLATKNECLQLKLVHRLHSTVDAPWPCWAWSPAAGHAVPEHHRKHLTALMPLYRGISTAKVGDGHRTLFWLDTGISGETIGNRWLVLMSHALRGDATVHSVLTVGVRQSLVPPLTDADERQLPALLALVDGVVLADAADWLDASAMSSCARGAAPCHDFVWKNSAPSKVQFFAWLLTKARI